MVDYFGRLNLILTEILRQIEFAENTKYDEQDFQKYGNEIDREFNPLFHKIQALSFTP